MTNTSVRLEMDSGEVFTLGIAHGSTVSITPMSTLDITINTTQGFQQAGTTVSGRELGGVSREISGAFISNAPTLADSLLRTATPFATGKMVYNDLYFCGIEIEKTPDIVTETALTTYDMMVYCPDPYWYAVDQIAGDTNLWVPEFEFNPDASEPTFDAHKFATRTSGGLLLENSGHMDTTYTLELTVLQDCTNIGIVNMDTAEKLQLDGSYKTGDTVTVQWVDGTLKILKNDTENIFSSLTDDSELFYLHPGGNLIESYAAEGNDCVSARLEFYAPYTGIHRAR